jgi:hypothetical protein
MKAMSRITPGISLAAADRGTMNAVRNPAATVARAPIDRRAAIIGRVNVMAAATLAYAGHERRMISPITITTLTQTASPATTAKIFLDILAPYERSRATPVTNGACSSRLARSFSVEV